MDDTENLAARFEQNRAHLTAVAYRMLGSQVDAEDAVQESWLRLTRSDRSDVQNLTGWLTTVVSRVCLDMLRSRTSRREDPLDGSDVGAPDATRVDSIDWARGGGATHGGPEEQAVVADSVGGALIVVLDTLSPAERLAFVLHDLFAVPFEKIGPIIDRSPAAARQLASRARRRVQGAPEPGSDAPDRRREIVAAFLAASRSGDFAALLAVLDPDVVLRADGSGVRMGSSAETTGAQDVAQTFSGRAQTAELALVDGNPVLVWMVGGAPRVVFAFTIHAGLVAGIELIADKDRIAGLDVVLASS